MPTGKPTVLRELDVTYLWLLPLFLFAVSAPLSVAGGNLTAALVIAAGATALALRRAVNPSALRRIALALLAVLVWNTVSVVFAPGGDRQWLKLGEEWWMKLMVLAVPLVLAGAGRRRGHVVATLLASGSFIAAYGILQHFTGQDLWRHCALHTTSGSFLAVGFTGHHLSFGGQLMFLAAAAAAVTMAAAAGGVRRWFGPATASALILLALVWSLARSSLLAVVAAGAFLVVIQTGRSRRLGSALLLAGVLAVALTPTLRGRMLATFTNPEEVTRLNLWRSSVSGITARPVTGWGPGNFDRLLAEYEYPGYYEARGHAHNDFLMQAVNAGVPGLLVFLWLHGEIFVLLWRTRLRCGDPGGLMAGAMACQVAALVGGMFQVFQTDDEPEMLLYFLLGCGVAAAVGALTRNDRQGANTDQPRPLPAE